MSFFFPYCTQRHKLYLTDELFFFPYCTQRHKLYLTDELFFSPTVHSDINSILLMSFFFPTVHSDINSILLMSFFSPTVHSVQRAVPERHQLHLQPGQHGRGLHQLGHPVHLPHHQQRRAEQRLSGEFPRGQYISLSASLSVLLISREREIILGF